MFLLCAPLPVGKLRYLFKSSSLSILLFLVIGVDICLSSLYLYIFQIFIIVTHFFLFRSHGGNLVAIELVSGFADGQSES